MCYYRLSQYIYIYVTNMSQKMAALMASVLVVIVIAIYSLLSITL